MLLFSFAFVAGTAYYLVVLPKGFLPSEDTGQIYAQHRGAGGRVVRGDAGRPAAGGRDRPPGRERGRRSAARVGAGGSDRRPSNAGRMFIRLKPRRRAGAVGRRGGRPAAAEDGRRCPGIKVYFQNPPPIRIGGRAAKSLYQLTIQGPDTAELYAAVPKLEERLRAMPELREVTSDLLIRSPQLNVRIDRDKATTPGRHAPGRSRTRWPTPTAPGRCRPSTPRTTSTGWCWRRSRSSSATRRCCRGCTSGRRPGCWCRSTRWSTVDRGVGPLTVNHSGQLPSVTLSFDLRPGVSLGDALAKVEAAAREELPADADHRLPGDGPGVPAVGPGAGPAARSPRWW